MRMYKGILQFVLHVLFVGGCDIELGTWEAAISNLAVGGCDIELGRHVVKQTCIIVQLSLVACYIVYK
jgi:hypothetical protein